jgi:uncharacterized protein YkwD
MVGLTALVAGAAIAGGATILNLPTGKSPEVPLVMGYDGAGNEVRQTGSTPPSEDAKALSGTTTESADTSSSSSSPASTSSSTTSAATSTSSKTSEQPAPPPPPPPPPPAETRGNDQPGSPNASMAAQVVALVNEERPARCALTVDERLTASAQGHSTDMANQNYFSHTSKDGRTFDQRIKAAGYPRPGGENIAKGQRTAESVMQAWMDSPGHRANIENCDFKTIGVGVDTRGFYWTQNFGF